MPVTTAVAPGWDQDESPFHEGERDAQQRAGVADFARTSGLKSIRRFMPEQHRTFFASLPFLMLGGLDAHGQPWATMRTGAPGFASALDERTLRIAGETLPGDPLADAWRPGALLGALGIQFETRRRNRVNGVVRAVHDDALIVAVEQSFGNCPRYIQGRTPTHLVHVDAMNVQCTRADSLSDADCELLAGADTFFIASANTEAGAGVARGVDVSHRGGIPGFVRIDDNRTMMTPDYDGNRFFNTIGNLLRTPRAGLLFIDFNSGDLLFIAAEAEVLWNDARMSEFTGAQRLIRYRVQEVRRSVGALPIRWSMGKRAPQFEALAQRAPGA